MFLTSGLLPNRHEEVAEGLASLETKRNRKKIEKEKKKDYVQVWASVGALVRGLMGDEIHWTEWAECCLSPDS